MRGDGCVRRRGAVHGGMGAGEHVHVRLQLQGRAGLRAGMRSLVEPSLVAPLLVVQSSLKVPLLLVQSSLVVPLLVVQSSLKVPLLLVQSSLVVPQGVIAGSMHCL